MPSIVKRKQVLTERAPREVIFEQYQAFLGTHCQAIFDTLPTMVMALNCCRQVVFANKAALSFFGRTDVAEILGERPGESLDCINAHESPGGCGTSPHCRNCGTLKAILASLDGNIGEGQCKLLRRDQSAIEGLDLRVNATPFAFGTQKFIIFALTDISHESRRRSMEHIFFHDVLNLAGGINGLAELLLSNNGKGDNHELTVLHSASQTLVDEIIAQRELLAAEANELHITPTEFGTRELLLQLKGLYVASPAAQGQSIDLESDLDNLQMVSDTRLVQRVLGNMLKNALEAGGQGDTVRLGCRDTEQGVRFEVSNRGFISREVQENIFHRRFSTKSDTRGIGTYSMLLLAERYLNGQVGYTSTESGGTCFFLLLPKLLEKA